MRKSVLAMLVVVGAVASGARAQLTNTLPDVQIMVMPGPNSSMVAAVYPRQVPHAETEVRLKRLALSGVPVTQLTFEDRRLERSASSFQDPKLRKAAKEVGQAPIMSSANFQVMAPLVDYHQGTLALEPFLKAFRDMKRINVTYLVPGQFTFRGMRQFADNRVEIAFSGQEGAFTYQVQVKDHRFESLNLPLREVARQESYRVVQNTPPQRLLVGTGIVALAALGIAGIAYAVSHRVLHR